MGTKVQILNSLAGTALLILIPAIYGPVLAQEAAQRDRVTARGSHYEVLKNPSKEDYLKCVYRNDKEFLCPDGAEFIAIEKHIQTKDYDLIALSTGALGSGTRWHDWKLIIDDGKKAAIETLADKCFECEVRIEQMKFRSNEVTFTYRQEQHLITATFRAGNLAIRKRKLDPHEPLDKESCDWLYNGLYGAVDSCKQNYSNLNSGDCTIAKANSGHFFVVGIEEKHAGISYEGLQRLCKAACSTGKAIDRSIFFNQVCRRKSG